MPKAIDQAALDSPNIKVLDINKPPTKDVPFEEFPKMVYLHPKDKTKEHLHKIVQDKKELEEHVKKGYRLKPHIPEAPASEIPEGFEADIEGKK